MIDLTAFRGARRLWRGDSATAWSAMVLALAAAVAGACNGSGGPAPSGVDVVVALLRDGDSLAVVLKPVARDPVFKTDTTKVHHRDVPWNSAVYRDSTMGDPPSTEPMRAVVVRVESRVGGVGAPMVGINVLNDSGARILRVGRASARGPEGDAVIGADHWSAEGDRPREVTLELLRCDSLAVEVVETLVPSHEAWDSVAPSLRVLVPDSFRIREITHRSRPAQVGRMPTCCETTSRRQAQRREPRVSRGPRPKLNQERKHPS